MRAYEYADTEVAKHRREVKEAKCNHGNDDDGEKEYDEAESVHGGASIRLCCAVGLIDSLL